MNKITLFSYGSLMLKQEIERTLGRILPESDLFPAMLKGYKREWSAVRENTASTYKWLLDHRTGVPPRFVAYLNLAEDGRSAVNGMAFQIEEDELQWFDRREMGYKRIEIDVFDKTGQPVLDTVFTYMDQTIEPVTNEVYINYHYLNLIRSLCCELECVSKGIRNDYFTQTPLPDACLEDLVVVYFNHDFSQLHELRLDKNPHEIQIASIQGNGKLTTHQTIADTDAMGLQNWRTRLMMACQPELSDEQTLLLENDPCFLVRTVLDYRTNKKGNIKTLLRRHLATSR